jgi:hypothetical protein
MKVLIIFLKKSQIKAKKQIVIKILIGNCQSIKTGKKIRKVKIK